MATFEEIHANTDINEGGFANDPADKGKMTWAGISRRWWPKWAGWPVIDAALAKWGGNVAKLNEELKADQQLSGLVTDFFRVNFWQRSRAGELTDSALQKSYYDMAVNADVKDAVTYLQQAINLVGPGKVAVDGIIGPRTIAAANGVRDRQMLVQVFVVLRGRHYVQLVEKDATQSKFLHSWLHRLFRNGVPI